MNIVGIKPLIAAMWLRRPANLAHSRQTLGIFNLTEAWFCCQASGLLDEGRMIHCGQWTRSRFIWL